MGTMKLIGTVRVVVVFGFTPSTAFEFFSISDFLTWPRLLPTLSKMMVVPPLLVLLLSLLAALVNGTPLLPWPPQEPDTPWLRVAMSTILVC